MNEKQWQSIRGFITDKGAVPLTSWDCIRVGVECIEKNVANHRKRERKSTKERQQMRDEIEALKAAAAGCSLDTRELLGFYLMSYMRAQAGLKSAEAYTIGNECDAIANAATDALLLLTNKTRGKGKVADQRRHFVIEAAGLFVEAGFKTIGAAQDSIFWQWLELLDGSIGLGLLTGTDSETGFLTTTDVKRLVRESIGKTADERAAYVAKRSTRLRGQIARLLGT